MLVKKNTILNTVVAVKVEQVISIDRIDGLTLSSSCTYAKVSLIKDMDDGQDSTLRVRE